MKTFEITIEQNGLRDVMKLDASSIIAALEKAHKAMQMDHDVTQDGYRIVGACQVYNAGAVYDGNLVRSEYPIPGGPNPDMWALAGKEKPVKPLTTDKS